MENMIDPWLYELRKERRERVRIVKKFLGIKPGDGKHLRYHGAYAMLDGQGYYVYHIIDDSLKGCKTGIEHYALVDPIDYTCRKATPDEALSLMMHQLPSLIID